MYNNKKLSQEEEEEEEQQQILGVQNVFTWNVDKT